MRHRRIFDRRNGDLVSFKSMLGGASGNTLLSNLDSAHLAKRPTAAKQWDRRAEWTTVLRSSLNSSLE